ncbi:hypothetical protein A2V68_02175 [candidate division Kazan bacterium RBG_13_50_9]|uniref:Cell division protein FtsL n=1 Tax=candidate division Kazan bacterium RBG_13_50_9 TaxID=1798535 RepID=A0A1F4NRT3_UNCK3|nr:MAG: hypothetical protein A2V68_02175 [candidate division Kazan bacterium RBG_13_50_9]
MNRFRKLRFGTLSVSSIAIILFLALGSFYMIAVNVASTKGARLHTLQIEKERIEDENERLALEAARLASLAVIEGGAQEQIEIGDDGKPTGKVVKPPTDEATDQPEEVTYVPKMIPMSGMDYLEPVGPLAQR